MGKATSWPSAVIPVILADKGLSSTPQPDASRYSNRCNGLLLFCTSCKAIQSILTGSITILLNVFAAREADDPAA